MFSKIQNLFLKAIGYIGFWVILFYGLKYQNNWSNVLLNQHRQLKFYWNTSKVGFQLTLRDPLLGICTVKFNFD